MPIEHSHKFDPTYGYTLETLLKVPLPEVPSDFEAFWKQTYSEARAVPLNIAVREIPSKAEGQEWFEVEYDAFGGARIGAWMTRPKNPNTPLKHGLVVGHGYGHREAPEGKLPVPNVAAIFPCARGLGRSRQAKFPDTVDRHVVHGIEHRETYIHRGCAAEIWGALSVLQELTPGLEVIDYLGGSYGGGIGALALAWEKRFRRAVLGVPSFGNHPLRVQLEMVGSGFHVREAYRKNPGVLDVLKYCDSANAARFITQPTLVEGALFDPAVPPPGQYSVYNGLAGPRELTVLNASHFGGYPGEVDDGTNMWAGQSKWLAL